MNTARPHRGQPAAGVAEIASSAPAVKPEVINVDSDCSDDEGAGNDNNDNNDDEANGTEDKGEAFEAFLLKTPSLRRDVREKAVADVSFAFSAFACDDNRKGSVGVSAGNLRPSLFARLSPPDVTMSVPDKFS